MNKVLLFGNLGADPELKMISNGNAVLKLRMATTEVWFDKNRQKQERTEWHSIVVWGKRAEALSKILTKGMRVLVEGSIQYSSYEDKNGIKRYRTEINAKEVELPGRSSGGGGGGRSRDSDDDYNPDEPDDGGGGGYAGGDDDIPF